MTELMGEDAHATILGVDDIFADPIVAVADLQTTLQEAVRSFHAPQV